MMVWGAGVVGFRREQPSTKNEPIWRVFCVWLEGGAAGKGRRGHGYCQTRKTRDMSRVFRVMGVVGGQVRAEGGSRTERTCPHGHVLCIRLQEKCPSTKIVPTRAQFSC